MASQQVETVSIPRHGQLGPTACQLVEALRFGVVGQSLNDVQLLSICGEDCRVGAKGYPSLGVAIEYTLKNFGVHWKRVPKEGRIKVLSAQESLEDVGSDLKGIHKKTRRTGVKAVAIKSDDLDEVEKGKLFAHVSQVGALELMSKSTTTKQLEAKHVKSQPSLPALLDLFS